MTTRAELQPKRKKRRFCACALPGEPPCRREITAMTAQAKYAPGHRQRRYERKRRARIKRLEASAAREGVNTTPSGKQGQREARFKPRRKPRWAVVKKGRGRGLIVVAKRISAPTRKAAEEKAASKNGQDPSRYAAIRADELKRLITS